MSDASILGQVALGYSPFIDRKRAVAATRLTVFPLRPDAVLDVAQLLEAVVEVWPASGGRVSLNVVSESLLHDLLLARPAGNLMVEVPAFMAADEANVEALCALHAHGSTLLLKGRPLKELPRAVLPCFKYSIIELDDDRRVGNAAVPHNVVRGMPFLQSGVRSVVDMEASFERGAEAVLGWPIDDAVSTTLVRAPKAVAAPGVQTVVELIRQLDKEEPIERLENTLKRDPPLAFKLLRYINSPAFGLRVEISSVRHAIMMLGYKRLKRWLALLLATASKDVNLRPVMFAAVRRGMLMEELVRHLADDQMSNELFICGMFSLLDRTFNHSFADLLQDIPVSERVYLALAEDSGPYEPYCSLARAVEGNALDAIREACERLIIGAQEINKAVLRALAHASRMG